MTVNSSFQAPGQYRNNHEDMLREHTTILTGVMLGKTNNTGSFTLAANATTTTLTFAKGRLSQGTVILWEPTTANAAAANTNLYKSAIDVANRTVTLTHANTATIDRTFSYILVG